MCWAAILLILFSCQMSERNAIRGILKEWIGKEILFPNINVNDIVKDADYIIVTSVDSTNCWGCKLRFKDWGKLEKEYASLNENVGFLFFLQTEKTDEIDFLQKWDKFTLPIFWDPSGSFDKTNNLPTKEEYRTFLLDRDYKVLAIGNPINNPNIKELYANIIQGTKQRHKEIVAHTTVAIEKQTFEFSPFNWQEEQHADFILHNTGNHLLIINQVTTTCGCMTVEFPQKPILPDSCARINITYKADKPAYFDKTIMVYCNTDISPVKLRITGRAQ